MLLTSRGSPTPPTSNEGTHESGECWQMHPPTPTHSLTPTRASKSWRRPLSAQAGKQMLFLPRGYRTVLRCPLQPVTRSVPSHAPALCNQVWRWGSNSWAIQRPSCRRRAPAALCCLGTLSERRLSIEARRLRFSVAVRHGANSRVSSITCFWMASTQRRFPSVR